MVFNSNIYCGISSGGSKTIKIARILAKFLRSRVARNVGVRLSWLLSFSSCCRFYLFLPKLQGLLECSLLAIGVWKSVTNLVYRRLPSPGVCSLLGLFYLGFSSGEWVCRFPHPTPGVPPRLHFSKISCLGGGQQMQRFRWRLEGTLRRETVLVVSRGLQFS